MVEAEAGDECTMQPELPGWARAYYPYYHGWMAPYPEEIPQDVAAAEEETAFLKQQAELLKK